MIYIFVRIYFLAKFYIRRNFLALEKKILNGMKR